MPPTPTHSGENVLGMEQRALSVPLGTTHRFCLWWFEPCLFLLAFLILSKKIARALLAGNVTFAVACRAGEIK